MFGTVCDWEHLSGWMPQCKWCVCKTAIRTEIDLNAISLYMYWINANNFYTVLLWLYSVSMFYLQPFLFFSLFTHKGLWRKQIKSSTSMQRSWRQWWVSCLGLETRNHNSWNIIISSRTNTILKITVNKCGLESERERCRLYSKENLLQRERCFCFCTIFPFKGESFGAMPKQLESVVN